MRTLRDVVQITLVWAVVGLLCFWPMKEARGADHTGLFETVSESRWEASLGDMWYRKYVTNEGTFVVTTILLQGRVTFRTWALCPKPEALDEIIWRAGEGIGFRNDCNGKQSEVTTPQYWEHILNDLPFIVRRIINYERMNMIRDPRMVWNI